MTTTLRPVVGLITIGQSPRPDVVPDMAEIIGPGVEIREAGALDGLRRSSGGEVRGSIRSWLRSRRTGRRIPPPCAAPRTACATPGSS